MRDYQACLERLRKDAAGAALVRDLATDKAKQELYDRLDRHFNQLADEVERAMNARWRNSFRNSCLEERSPGSGAHCREYGAAHGGGMRARSNCEARADVCRQNRSIPNMKSNATVTAPDSSNDPRQPNRFEKKKNMSYRLCIICRDAAPP